MDAIKFLKEKNRMTKLNSDGTCKTACRHCPLSAENNGFNLSCSYFMKKYPEKAVSIVEKWSAEHLEETRQSKFLKVYPDAQILENGAIQICPIRIEKSKKFNCRTSCDTCRKEYWLSEVE